MHPDGPHAVDGDVIRGRVRLSVLGDVRRANKVLHSRILERALANVRHVGQRVLDEVVDGLEALILDGVVRDEPHPQGPTGGGDHRGKVVPAELSCNTDAFVKKEETKVSLRPGENQKHQNVVP